jgi:PLP dependent protein
VIRENLAKIEERLENALNRAGRSRSELRLMAVSKTRPVELIQEACEAGLRLFGENRVLEAAEKFTGRFPDVELHLIGHIQRNKAKKAVETAGCIQSVDAVRTVNALDKHAAEIDRVVNILVEVNTGGENAKQGVRKDDAVFSLIDFILERQNIKLQGLMTMAPFTDDSDRIRECFCSLYNLRQRCMDRYGAELFEILSMGMTNDYEIAVEEGSTLVRIGTALFGAR